MSPATVIPRPTAYALLVFNMALWGGSLVVVRGAHEIVPPLALTFWRWVLAVAVLLPIVWRKLPGTLTYLRRRWHTLALLCGTMVYGTTASVIAVNHTTALNASLINGSQPILTAVIAFLLFRERLSLVAACGIAAAFLGLLVMISQGQVHVILDMAVNIGDVAMLSAVVAWALYAIELHRQPEHLEGDVLMFLIACVGLIAVLPLYLVETIYYREFIPTWAGVAAISYVSLFSTVLAVFLWNLAIRSVGALHSALFMNLVPLFGAVFAIFFLGEKLFSYHLVGATLVFFGIGLAVRERMNAGNDPSPR
jgi:drug/metabolite transporter (DMT)-like permease